MNFVVSLLRMKDMRRLTLGNSVTAVSKQK